LKNKGRSSSGKGYDASLVKWLSCWSYRKLPSPQHLTWTGFLTLILTCNDFMVLGWRIATFNLCQSNQSFGFLESFHSFFSAPRF